MLSTAFEIGGVLGTALIGFVIDKCVLLSLIRLGK